MKLGSVVLLATVICFSGSANEAPKRRAGASMIELFAEGDFLPHVATLKEVRSELGMLHEVKDGQGRAYVYQVATRSWLTFRPNEWGEEKYSWIEEVIYSRFPPDTKSASMGAGKALVSDKLMGVGLGDHIDKLSSLGVKFRKTTAQLFGKQFVVYECTPLAGQYDLFYRYYTVDDRVEAFSMGVTE